MRKEVCWTGGIEEKRTEGGMKKKRISRKLASLDTISCSQST
ncbi:predicted protein [Plenodomus lingam JN3]|uniref:Predicted protein n=1 Tax=Leptosphaeria maculans (strain JN3 / isolate v23.1.3 / race Av1-4-5-6-7-8) TaxID=985895 RepID=E4ZZL3_LEPMJ|nr:predicted protein [Plenodomus lingam JN3]CBX97129.1 predicted protein [Plenodomus lingam JN3]